MELLYKELCYKIAGLAFEVYKSLGSGLKESIYADAFEELLKQEGISYKREIYYPVKIRDKVVSKNFFDFLIDDKLVIELKAGNRKYREVCDQLFQYLRVSNLQLGLIIRITNDGARIKRIPNLY